MHRSRSTFPVTVCSLCASRRAGCGLLVSFLRRRARRNNFNLKPTWWRSGACLCRGAGFSRHSPRAEWKLLRPDRACSGRADLRCRRQARRSSSQRIRSGGQRRGAGVRRIVRRGSRGPRRGVRSRRERRQNLCAERLAGRHDSRSRAGFRRVAPRRRSGCRQSRTLTHLVTVYDLQEN